MTRQAALGAYQVRIGVRTAVAEELPRLTDLLDLVEIHVAHEQFLVVGAAQVAGPEIELLPEPLDVGDVGLAVRAQVRAVGVDDGGRVVVDAGGLGVFLVHRHDEDHPGLLREVLHPLRRGAVGDVLRVAVVLRVLDLAEVRPVEELLEEHHLGALLRRLVGVLLVLLDHRFLVARPAGLEERAPNDARHPCPHLACAEDRREYTPRPAAGRLFATGLPAVRTERRVRRPRRPPETARMTAAPTIERATEAAAQAAHEETLPTPVALERGRMATVVGILGLLGFLGIFGAVRARRSEAFDLAMSLRVQGRRSPFLDRVMAAASWLGFPPQSRVVPPAILAALFALRFPVEAGFEALAWGAGLLSTLLQEIMKRPRPVAGEDLRVVAAPLGGGSFPRGPLLTHARAYGVPAPPP